MLDPTGHVASWNAGAQRSKGYAPDEIIGQHFRVFYPPDVAARKHPEHELELALRDGSYEEEGWRLRKDGTRFWANVLITAVYNSEGEHIGFAKVTRDTTERRRLEQEREQALAAVGNANEELERLNARLRQAAEDQSQFLAVTAHELRTPVAVLGGSAEMLAHHWDELEDAEREELFDSMRASTGRLRRLLDDLLTASRLQNNALSMRSERIAAADIVDVAVSTVRSTQPQSEIVVHAGPPVHVRGDRDRLAQALENLVSNALRHGRPPVEISVEEAGDRVRICVRDHGTGVAEGVRGRLFERFVTGMSRGGTGLGLFIVRELARAHGGDADYEPSADGSSGVFVIELPREP
jgi:PAS domain S-box-containing protein